MLKRFYFLLSIFSAALLSPLFIFPLGLGYNLVNILFLVYPFIPFFSLLILYRRNWSQLWKTLNFSKGKQTTLSILKSCLFWHALFYANLLFATTLGIYSWDFEQGGLSSWLSDRLNEFANTNQVPIPLLPLTTKQMAQLGIAASLLAPFILFPFFFIQELVWRGWLLGQYEAQAIFSLLKINAIWGIWQLPLISLGLIYSDPLLGIPAIVISASLQGTLLSMITQKTGSIFSATIARGIIFASTPLTIIFHGAGSTTSPLVVGFYGISSWILMGGAILWFARREKRV